MDETQNSLLTGVLKFNAHTSDTINAYF